VGFAVHPIANLRWFKGLCKRERRLRSARWAPEQQIRTNRTAVHRQQNSQQQQSTQPPDLVLTVLNHKQWPYYFPETAAVHRLAHSTKFCVGNTLQQQKKTARESAGLVESLISQAESDGHSDRSVHPHVPTLELWPANQKNADFVPTRHLRTSFRQQKTKATSC